MKHFSCFFIAVLTLLAEKSFCQRDCSDVIKYAGISTTRINESEDVTNSVFNFLKTEELKKYMKKQSGGFSLGIDGYSIGANSSDGEYSKFFAYLNSQSSVDFKKRIVKSYLYQLPNENAVKAWLLCTNSPGLFTDYFNEGEGYKFSIGYRPTLGTNSVTVDTFIVSNGSYNSNMIKKGTSIWNDPTEVEIYPIDKNKDITIEVILTTENAGNSRIGKSFIIPGKVPDLYPNIAGTWINSMSGIEIYTIKQDPSNKKEFTVDITYTKPSEKSFGTAHGYFVTSDSANVTMKWTKPPYTCFFSLYWKLAKDGLSIRNTLTLTDPSNTCDYKWEDYNVKVNGEYPTKNTLLRQ